MPRHRPVYSEAYYQHIARILGQAAADWARLPRAERDRELMRLHAQIQTPDDLSIWPPELVARSATAADRVIPGGGLR